MPKEKWVPRPDHSKLTIEEIVAYFTDREFRRIQGNDELVRHFVQRHYESLTKGWIRQLYQDEVDLEKALGGPLELTPRKKK